MADKREEIKTGETFPEELGKTRREMTEEKLEQQAEAAEEKRQNWRKTLVDVIIPTYYPKEKFYECLRMLQKQTLPVHRLIIVNTEKQGLPKEKVWMTRMPYDIIHIEKKDFDHGRTRNLGAGIARGDYLLFMTDDAVPRDIHLLENLVKMMQSDARIGSVYGRQLATEESSPDEQFSRRFNYPERSFVKSQEDLPRLGIKTYFQSDVCCLYRRDLFEKLGGFPEHVIFNEDMLYCAALLKAGYLSAYCASAEVYHSHHYNGKEQFRRNFDLGVSQADHPEVFSGIRSEGEGMKLVWSCMKWLIRTGKAGWVPKLVYLSACKYLGFRLGKRYRKLPKERVLKYTAMPEYFTDL